MNLPRSRKVLLNVLIAFAAFIAITVGIGLGLALASTRNIRNIDEFGDGELALPSQVLDRHGRLITEFFSAERRDIVSIDELPNHLIYALIVREDQDFFRHNGFSVRGTVRAAWNIFAGRYVSGGSTITQQLAGHMFDDRDDISVARKLRELWWAFQLERTWTKHEIIEAYLNRMYFGHNTYGVEAASQFYFGHSARELTPAESVMLVIQLANPSRYSPLRNPERARNMQRVILNAVVNAGYISRSEADFSFEEYWANYDFTRSNISSAFLDRSDEAPYFSEYVRGQLQGDILLGRPVDINRAGLVIHTTLDLDHQRQGEQYLREGLERANASVRRAREVATSRASRDIVPLLDLLGLAFDLPDLQVSGLQNRRAAQELYDERIAPIVSMTSLLFSPNVSDGIYHATRMNQITRRSTQQQDQVQGALVTLDNRDGHITAMIGGAQFERIDQLNRAVSGRRTPGSAFKALYYAAAIDSQAITPATMLYDSPVVFRNEDGSMYTPRNYAGNWNGPMLVREALNRSLNIPAVRVFHRTGFTTALGVSAALLGIPESDMAGRGLERRYPVALGVSSVSPLEMTRAYATFASGGRQVDPIAVRYIEDQRGRVIAEPERDLRIEQQRRGAAGQIVSPEAAYIMTDLMRGVFTDGTLRAQNPIMPMAAKSGTTQNWSDGWVVGYSPYYTTTIWYGFDRGGRSLGTNQYGAALAGPVWGGYMNTIHQDLPSIDFERPDGLVEVEIAIPSGLRAPSGYTGRRRTELFIPGTEPREFAPSLEETAAEASQRSDRLRSIATSEALIPSRAQLDSAIPTLDELLGDSSPGDTWDSDFDFDADIDFDDARFEDDIDDEGDGNPLLD
ncbi:MAG: PBP1A family penicillin-binding protein [Spirochaetaceae bacterium]|nr:MAG: PBP1A family penicillin-binding protein [Spirochaetaceae bacterium]